MSSPRLPKALLRMVRRITPKRYIIIHGFYGMGNVGDEAILEATLEEVRRVSPLEPFVFAWNPVRVRKEFGVHSVNPNRERFRLIARVLLQADAYLLGGGGLIKDYGDSPASLARWLCWPEVAHDLGIRTMLWSVGVENVMYGESRIRVRRVVSDMNVVTVRDPESAERLRDVGVTRPVIVSADPVPHFVRSRNDVEWRGRRGGPDLERIGVCLRHWFTFQNSISDEEVFDRFLAAVANALDTLGTVYGSEIVFIPFRTTDDDDDRVICRAVGDRMQYSRIVYFEEKAPSVRQTLRRIATVDLMIGMRLHAAVAATAMGIPTVAISYMPKVADYMASIDQSEYCRPLEEVSSEWLVDRANSAVSSYLYLSTALDSATARLSDRFRQNGRLLAELLQ